MRVRELGVLARSAVAHLRTRRARPQFAEDLAALTTHPDWLEMLRHNPIRAEHEYRWYFASRFPGTRLEMLTATTSAASGGIRFGTPGQGADRPPLLPVMPMNANPCLGIVDWGIGGVGLVRALDRAGTRAAGAVLVGRRRHPLRPDGNRRAGRPPHHGGRRHSPSGEPPRWCWRATRPARWSDGLARRRFRWRESSTTGWPPFPKSSPDRSAW